MLRKIDLHQLQKKIQTVKTEEKKEDTRRNTFQDIQNNINNQVFSAFDNLPGIQNKKKEVSRLRDQEKDMPENKPKQWIAASRDLEVLRKKSRVEHPQVLFDLLANITKRINTNPVNARFIDQFKSILRHYHKDIYAGVRNTLSAEQKDQLIFTTVMRRLSNRIATHKKANLDSLATFKILKECGFSKKVTYMKESSHKEIYKGHLNVDVGGINGVKVTNIYTDRLDHTSLRTYTKTVKNLINQITMILAHNNAQNNNGHISHGTASCTYMMFKLLQCMNAIPTDKYDHIMRFVKFVDIVDSAGIEVIGNDFENSHKTLIGLQKLILEDYKNIDFLYNQFGNIVGDDGTIQQKPKTGFEILSDEYLQNTNVYVHNKEKPLKDLSDAKYLANQKSSEVAEKLLDENKIITSHVNGQSFLVDVAGQMMNAREVANSMGRGVIKLLPDGKISIYSPTYMQFDDKTWSTFGDYTRGHILFIDPSKISDWSRFEKVLFNDPANKSVLAVMRSAILEKRKQKNDQSAKVKAKEQSVKVKSIIHGAVAKFVNSKPPMHISDIEKGKEYDVLVNNTKLIDDKGVFVTFAKNADMLDIEGKNGNINGIIPKGNISPKQKLYYQSLVEGESVIRILVKDVLVGDGSCKIELSPILSEQSREETNVSTKTA